MSPPQLTADTPVFDVFQPVAICVFVLGRVELQFVVHDRRQCHVSKMLHAQEPLHRQFRFDSYVGTFRKTYFISICFHLFQQVGSSQIFFNLFANIEAIHAYIQTGSLADSSVVVENIDRRQVVFFSQHIVVHIVCRSYFQTACTEFDVNIIIFDNRNDTSYQRNDNLFPFQPVIFRVVRVDTHSSISHNGFRTCCCYYSIAASLCIAVYHFSFGSGFTTHVVVGNIIAQIIKFAVLFFVDNLFIAECCQCFWIPVDHAYTTVNQSFII